MTRITMNQLSYGLTTPESLLEKLIEDGDKLSREPHPHDVFNFIVTAAVLYEWISKIYANNSTVSKIKLAMDKQDFTLLPDVTSSWIIDNTCLPNRHCDIRRHIMNATQICRETANASKHYHWVGTSKVKAIEPEPIVGDYYQYFHTSVEPDLYIDYDGECYGLSQLRSIIFQVYEGLLVHLGLHSGTTAKV